MKAKIICGELKLIAECEQDVAWIRQASRHNFLRTISASVGAGQNWLTLNSASGFHAYELTSLLRGVSQKLEVINEAFMLKDGEK